MAPWVGRMRLGVAIGLVAATMLSAWVLGIALVTGAALLTAGAERTDVRTIVVAYYAAGLACGAVGGILVPLGRWRVGAAVAGMLGATALYGAIEAVRHGRQRWTGEDSVVLVILAVVVGAPVGLIYRDIFFRERRVKRKRPGARRPEVSPPVAQRDVAGVGYARRPRSGPRLCLASAALCTHNPHLSLGVGRPHTTCSVTHEPQSNQQSIRYVWRPPWRRGLAWAVLGCTACTSLTDPALPPGTTRLAPPRVYARWWAMTEACSGRTGDLAAITWYVATGSHTISDGRDAGLTGYWSAATNRIVLADTAGLDGGAIRHEMLHALVRQPGHPRDQFLGRCAGTVPCSETCIADAGPPPAPDPAAVPVGADALQVRGEVAPAAPGTAIDGGWFTFTVLVTNARTTPVVVTLQPSGDAGPPVSFSYDATCGRGCDNGDGTKLGGFIYDDRVTDRASATRFAAGETKRLVVDFRVGGPRSGPATLPAGTYAFTGYYGSRHAGGVASTPVVAVVGP